MDTILIGEEKIIKFDAEILYKEKHEIEVQFKGTFEYNNIELDKILYGTEVSNVINMKVYFPNLDISMTANKDTVILGDTITYVVDIVNTGDIDAIDILYKDSIQNSVEIIDGSFSINGQIIHSVNTFDGINIDMIPIGGTKKLQYSVRVIAVDGHGEIENQAIINFANRFDEGHNATYSCFKSKKVKIATVISAFCIVNLNEILSFYCDDVKKIEIVNMQGSSHIYECYVINSSEGSSLEGQHITDKKLIVHAFYELAVEYCDEDANDGLRVALYKLPFSTYIILPKDYNKEYRNNIHITTQIFFQKMISDYDFLFYCKLLVFIK